MNKVHPTTGNELIMMKEKVRIIRVASVQMESKDCCVDFNLKRATIFAEQAAKENAQIVLFPELMPTGYLLSKKIWDAAEPKEGATVIWLRQTSKNLKLWLGTSFLEADGKDFYNTFVLTNPDGEDIIRVRKQTPAAMESYFFKGEKGVHSVDTELGRIGIGICYEGWRSYWSNLMHQELPDLILMPLSVPIFRENYYTSKKNIEDGLFILKSLPQQIAQKFGVPVVMANKCGVWKTSLPFPFGVQDTTFPGFSQIIDSDGTIKKRLTNNEGIIVENVVLDTPRKFKTPDKNYGRWSIKVPSYFNFMAIGEAIGKICYAFNLDLTFKET
ncbi:MAG TPA: carbon-nitrogen hydrolase family protein [Candidatus Methylomirabilis sp.]|nr:carbon-nitrogen hydrolase family protein [Candidatus Methylomirabilis sp.]